MSSSSVTNDGFATARASDRDIPYSLILTIFFLSGASALVYQTAWQRLLGLFSGSDTVAATIVVGAFLLGLGLGSLWGAAMADRLSRRAALGAFAVCEVGIGLFAAFSPTLFYDVLFGELIGLARRADLVIALTFLALLPPTLLMGLSLPLLARAVADRAERIASDVGLLYGLNTLGAAVGTFAAGWIVIGTIGYTASIFLGVALNLLVALGAVQARRALPPDFVKASPVRTEATAIGQHLWHWNGLVFLSGFLIIALEIVWFRLLGVMMQGNAYAFSLILAVFLLGDGMGIVAGTALVRRVRDLRRFFLLLQGGMASYALLSALLLYWLHASFSGFIGGGSGLYDSLPLIFGIMALCTFIVLPPAFLLGMSFPIAQGAVQDDPGLVGQRVGLIQLFNILGNALGALVAGLLLLHWLGTLGTLRLIAIAGIALLVPALREWRPGRTRWAEVAVVVATLVPFALLPGNSAFWARLHGAEAADISAVAEDRSGIAAFTKDDEEEGWKLFITGHQQSHLPFAPHHVALGLFGVAVHPDPKSVLIIGQGTGGTPYGAGANAVTQRIRVVELVEPVLELTAAYAADARDPGIVAYYADPRYERIVGDGRHLLAIDDTAYDVIEADAIYPHSSRAGMLYSVEHFSRVRERLAPGGICVQWRATSRTAWTFATVFPHVVQVGGWALLGSNEPIEVDLEKVAAMVNGPMADYLRQAGLSPEEVLAELGTEVKVIKAPKRPRGGLNTDLFPRDEYYLNDRRR